MGGGASVAKREEVPKYLQTIRKGNGSKLVQTLTLVETLSGVNDNKTYLGTPSLGLISEICDILNKDQGEARDISLRIASNISSVPDNSIEMMDTSHGMPVLLANILKTAPNSTRVLCFNVLLNLAANPKNAEKLINPLHGLIAAIITAFDAKDKELSKYSVALLGILFSSKEGAGKLGPAGVPLLRPITAILLERTGSLLAKTIVLMKRMAETAVTEVRVAASDPKLGLLNALLLVATNSRNDSGVHKNALKAISLIINDPQCVANVAIPGNGLIAGLANLVAIDDVSTEAMTALEVVTTTKVSKLKVFFALSEAGISAAISEVLGNKLSPLDRKLWAIKSLKNLLSVEDNKRILGAEKFGILPLLVSYVRSRLPEMMADSLICLSIFCLDSDLVPQMAVPKLELMPTLVSLIRSEKGELRSLAIGFFINVADAPSTHNVICSYQLGLLAALAPVLEQTEGQDVFLTLSLLHKISKTEVDHVWFSTTEQDLLPRLVAIASADRADFPERKQDKKFAFAIIKNMSKTPANRQFMATPKLGLIPFLIQKCKGSGRKKSELAVETLANIAEDSAALCEPFINFEFFDFLVETIRSPGTDPSEWAAESVESTGLTLLMNICQWSQVHLPLRRIAECIPTLARIAAGKEVQGTKAALALAMLIGSSEEEADEVILRSYNICLRVQSTVFVNKTRSSRNVTNLADFPIKLTLRALWYLSTSDVNKPIILSSPKLAKDLAAALRKFVDTPSAAKFDFEYELAKGVAELILEVLLSLTTLFATAAELLTSDAFSNSEDLIATLTSIKTTDIRDSSKHSASMLSWRLSDAKVDDDEALARNYIAIIYHWPVDQTAQPELLQCFALSLKSMNYNVVMVENGICRSQTELSAWELPVEESFPEAILSRCSGVVIAVSSGLNDSPACRLMVSTAVAMRNNGELAIEYISADPELSLERADKKLGRKCCSAWLRRFIGPAKIPSLWAITNVEPTSNKIGEAFDGVRELRGERVPRKKKKAIQYTKKDPKGNSRRYEVAWGILQIPNKASKKDELSSLITSIGVYNATDLQICDFDDLMCMSKLLKKVQMRNFVELVFDIVPEKTASSAKF